MPYIDTHVCTHVCKHVYTHGCGEVDSIEAIELGIELAYSLAIPVPAQTDDSNKPKMNMNEK